MLSETARPDNSGKSRQAGKKLILILFLILPLNLNAQWFWQNPLPQGNRLQSVYFMDSNIGWAVGWIGTILKTTNSSTRVPSRPRLRKNRNH